MEGDIRERPNISGWRNLVDAHWVAVDDDLTHIKCNAVYSLGETYANWKMVIMKVRVLLPILFSVVLTEVFSLVLF